jgi:putative ABC transport system permease protein
LDAEFFRARARRPSARPSWQTPRFRPALAWNYLKIGLRKLRAQKMYSLINIAGLAVAIAGCILIFLFVRQEWSYDNFHAAGDRIYRMALQENYSQQERFFNTVTPFPLGPKLKRDYSEVIDFARVVEGTSLVKRDDVSFFDRYHIVDPSLLEMFSFPLVKGDRARALRDPGSIVLTESAARKYFGSFDPIGRVLTLELGDRPRDFRVTAVAKDVPENSSIRFTMLIALEPIKDIWNPAGYQSWTNVNPETYIELAPGAKGSDLQPKLEAVSKLALGSHYKPGVYNLRVQPLRSIHLDKSYPSGIEPTSDPAYSYVLFGIGLLVLLVACINFITLSVGRAATRAREVGIRKVVGAARGQLMRQFWGEAVLIAFLALVLGLVLARLFLPTFRSLSGKALVLTLNLPTIGVLAAIMVVVGLLAGSYPALVLSGFRPVDVLKGKLKVSRKAALQRALVVFQFVLSISLIACTLIMSRQLRYLRTKDLGFRGQQVVVLRTNRPRNEGVRILELLKNEAARRPDILGTAGAAYTFGEGWTNIGFTSDSGLYRECYLNIVTPDYLTTMGMSVAEGRGFSGQVVSDIKTGILVNETLARQFGLEPAVGKPLPGRRFPAHTIVGVVKDFHFQSLHDPIRPLVLVLDPEIIRKGVENINSSSSGYLKIFVRIKPDNIPATLAGVRGLWDKVAPGLPFDYSFLDSDLDRQYHQDEQWGRIVRYSSLFAVLIACLGLFGLTSLVVTQRFKEIGIRKVLGSSVPGVVGLLSWDFIKLVVMSNLLAWPLAYYAMNRWLQGFAYRLDIGFGSFLLAAVVGAAIAQVTIGTLALRAALVNPVDVIHYE